MNLFKASIDNRCFRSKPERSEIAGINERIGRSQRAITTENLKSFVWQVSERGYSFCPATFSSSKSTFYELSIKKKDYFEQLQLLALDFDGGITIQETIERAEEYDLPILFAYETLSSVNKNKFRIVFLNDAPIFDTRIAKLMLNALLTIFPEADPTSKDVSKMYFGGKRSLYFDKNVPTVNIELLIRSMTIYMKNKYGSTHYKRHIEKFARSNSIALTKKKMLDILVAESEISSNNSTKFDDVNSSTNPSGKLLPTTIILSTIGNGNNLPTVNYRITLNDGTRENSTSHDSVEKINSASRPRTAYRSSILDDIGKVCKLYSEFENGTRKLHHHEQLGVALNLFHIESGINRFRKILLSHPKLGYKNIQYWNDQFGYFKQGDYKPQSCDSFCPYKDTCKHGTNILSTVKPQQHTMEKDPSYNQTFYSVDEVHADVRDKLEQAISSNDRCIHVIKAQTAIGKTEAFLRLMEGSDSLCLVAVPTNILKNDVYERAIAKGIDVIQTPSLDEVQDEIPHYVWEHIRFLRETGQGKQSHGYIKKMAKKHNIGCLTKYLKSMKKFENSTSHAITTHRRFLNMDEKTLKKYDVIIIDEDIIFNSIISNQCEIPISTLKEICQMTDNSKQHRALDGKIRLLLKKVKHNSLVKLHSIEWDNGKKTKNDEDDDGISALTDIPSFCLATHFMYRKSSEEENISEDSIVFIKPTELRDIKCIMVSATADKDVCEYVFGKNRVKFYDCKQAKYEGTLNQYYDKSYSRSSINAHPNLLEEIRERSGFEHMITFKKYGGEYYFGNCLGVDKLKGESIDVVGTPYHAEFLYKIIPFTLGLDVDPVEKMKNLTITHNGYRVRFKTYEDEVLQKFQLWMLESDLEQAVGRARLLRCNCTVNVYTRLPLSQATMVQV